MKIDATNGIYNGDEYAVSFELKFVFEYLVELFQPYPQDPIHSRHPLPPPKINWQHI